MTDYSWPSSITPATDNLTWLDNTVVFRSKLGGTIRTESRPGGRWFLSLAMELENSVDLGLLEAFLFRLNGAENRAVIKDFSYARNGPGGGSPLVNGASQTGKSLITDGWTPSTKVLYAGDRIGISNQMIPLASDATSNASGQVTLSLTHSIRTAPANNAAIEISNPTARYILVNKASFAASPGVDKVVLAEFEEAIP